MDDSGNLTIRITMPGRIPILQHAVPTSRPPQLSPKLSVPDAAGRVLRQAFRQFVSNLEALRTAKDPEVVHQARIGWRRFKSGLRLFRPVLVDVAEPPWEALQPLLLGLGELRNLEVALHETLPRLAQAYIAGDTQRAAAWRAFTHALTRATHQQRQAVRATLQQPAVGAALRASTQWLQELPGPRQAGTKKAEKPGPLRPWARRRLTRLHRQLRTTLKTATDAEGLHRVRILAKRLRYGIEALRPLLPAQRARRWHQQALALQTELGARRDIAQVSALAEQWAVDRGLTEFLRGVSTSPAAPGRKSGRGFPGSAATGGDHTRRATKSPEKTGAGAAPAAAGVRSAG